MQTLRAQISNKQTQILQQGFCNPDKRNIFADAYRFRIPGGVPRQRFRRHKLLGNEHKAVPDNL